ncbi:MAG: hypothetical protein IKF90_24630 [Parasporobacterium sp.]|nr:hypothetical protein [Parasporobacterium sp.]
METNTNNVLDTIKKYRFAILPPRISKQEADLDRKKESETGKYSVQCQICGRMGAMSIDDMRKHAEMHEKKEAEKKNE